MTREDRIRNEYITSIGVVSITEKMRKNRLRCFWSCYEKRRFGSSMKSYGIERERKKRLSPETKEEMVKRD